MIQIISMNINNIKPYENNPRVNDKAVDAVARSIERYGFKQPIIVDKNNVIVAGHTRHKASLKLGLKEVPVVVADDLTEEQIREFRIVDNKTAELSVWDIDKLDFELSNLGSFNIGDFTLTQEPRLPKVEDEIKDATEDDNYSIMYKLVFNNEYEQSRWFEFLKYLKENYKGHDTISERLMEFLNNEVLG